MDSFKHLPSFSSRRVDVELYAAKAPVSRSVARSHATWAARRQAKYVEQHVRRLKLCGWTYSRLQYDFPSSARKTHWQGR